MRFLVFLMFNNPLPQAIPSSHKGDDFTVLFFVGAPLLSSRIPEEFHRKLYYFYSTLFERGGNPIDPVITVCTYIRHTRHNRHTTGREDQLTRWRAASPKCAVWRAPHTQNLFLSAHVTSDLGSLYI